MNAKSNNNSATNGRMRTIALMETIVGSLKEKDKLSLKSAFSIRAMRESDNFDVGFNYLCSLIGSGDVKIIVDNEDRPLTDYEWDNGKMRSEEKSWYTLETSNGELEVFLVNYPIDTIDPDNCGIYALRIINISDVDRYFTYWQDMMKPGIFVPEDTQEN